MGPEGIKLSQINVESVVSDQEGEVKFEFMPGFDATTEQESIEVAGDASAKETQLMKAVPSEG